MFPLPINANFLLHNMLRSRFDEDTATLISELVAKVACSKNRELLLRRMLEVSLVVEE